MFAKTLIALSFGLLAAATPWATTTVTVTTENPAPTTISQCNTGDAQCCNVVGAANTIPGITTILGLVGVVLAAADAVVGVGCAPITVGGLGQGANCAQQPVCCEYNNFNGLINIGCDPISL